MIYYLRMTLPTKKLMPVIQFEISDTELWFLTTEIHVVASRYLILEELPRLVKEWPYKKIWTRWPISTFGTHRVVKAIWKLFFRPYQQKMWSRYLIGVVSCNFWQLSKSCVYKSTSNLIEQFTLNIQWQKNGWRFRFKGNRDVCSTKRRFSVYTFFTWK